MMMMMSSTIRLILPRSGTTISRCLSSSSRSNSATPEWQQLIGGRAGVERKRILYLDKYKRALESKASKEGISVEELKRKVEERTQVEAKRKSAEREAMIEKTKASLGEQASEIPAGSGSKTSSSKPRSTKKQQSTPVKPLEDILDLSKASTLTTSQISQLWTAFHQSKGFLSAAIPTETYQRMLGVAKKYPLFVLPLARDIIGDLPPGVEAGSKGAVEMHFLEWAFLPPPSNISEPVPSPSTVLFTPLAEYKSRVAFAQPYLILTHYTDLSQSHNVVLMRGEISDSVALGGTEAQVLAVRLQLFYNPSGEGGERERERFDLLEKFHEKPEEFDLDRLVATAWEL